MEYSEFRTPDAALEERKYAAKCSKRMQSVLTYVKGPEFFTDVCVGALSAIPRWHFARVLEVKGAAGTSPRLGNALVAYYESTCQITRGRNELVEHLVNREPDVGEIKLCLFGSLMRSYLYLADKNG